MRVTPTSPDRGKRRYPARCTGRPHGVGDFIALDNRPRAASFVAEIEAKIVEVGERPGSFQKRDDLHKGLRHVRHGRYLIFFIKVGDEVQIVRVIEGSRDLPGLFEL
ncbi:type II toxin-antitoxin system RelE/ParE family toxin [Sulfitobacter sp. AS92]|uniref:type II toxin-antitoxin system RelE/ParE family toxin n=1 Tax=Sulfitobacter sp. AS92 TaxID=3135783 RepID=UPI00317BA113